MGTVTRFIRAVYGPAISRSTPLRPVPLKRSARVPWLVRLQRYYRNSPRKVWIIVGVACGVVAVALTIHYYNLLVGDHVDALAARGKVQALLQRRSDLARTLEQIIVAHKHHEAAVFADVAQKRVSLGKTEVHAGAGLPALSPGDVAGLPAALGRLLAIAEQYPQLRLSENFRLVTNALVEVERDLDKTRQHYVDAANRYEHHLDTFPGNVFGGVFGFGHLPYFEADAEAKKFTPAKF